MNHKPEIAIIEPNTLTALGLKNILEEIIPMAVIRTFRNFGELIDDTPDMYAHYFISAQIYVEHNTFFLPRKKQTIVLAGGSSRNLRFSFGEAMTITSSTSITLIVSFRTSSACVLPIDMRAKAMRMLFLFIVYFICLQRKGKSHNCAILIY